MTTTESTTEFPAPTTADLDEYYDDLIYEEKTGLSYADALGEAEAEMRAENAWLIAAENAGPTYHEELRQEGFYS